MRLDLPPLPDVLACREVEVSLAAVRARFGELGADERVSVAEIEADLRRRPSCRERPEEVERALRTLAQRDTVSPLILFRHLFKQACAGDLLCDADADAERIVAAEQNADGVVPARGGNTPEKQASNGVGSTRAQVIPQDARAARLQREGRYWADLEPPPGEQPLPLFVKNVPPPLPRPMNHEERALARARRLRVAGLEPPPTQPRTAADAVSRFLDRARAEGFAFPDLLRGSSDSS